MIEHEQKRKDLELKKSMAPEYDRNKRISIKTNPKNRALIMDPTTNVEFKEAIDIYKKEIDDRNFSAELLFESVKKMLQNKCRDVKTQTVEAYMN